MVKLDRQSAGSNAPWAGESERIRSFPSPLGTLELLHGTRTDKQFATASHSADFWRPLHRAALCRNMPNSLVARTDNMRIGYNEPNRLARKYLVRGIR